MGRDRSSCPSRPAFTLIEVLVVVAIIALLVSILLPSLSRAREQGRAVACAANIGQILRAENTYQTQNKEWIPGSPVTTGFHWAKTGNTNWNPFASIAGSKCNRFTVEWMDWANPLRALMYGPNSVPRPAANNAAALKAARSAMFLAATDGVFHCPSNALAVRAFPSPAGYPVIRGVSYLTMWTLMRAGPGLYSRHPGMTGNPGWYAQADSWDIVPPADYMPRHSRIGRESLKVFIADGFRYFNPPNELDYTTEACSAKGMMSGEPPSTYSTTPDYCREYTTSKKYSYRHGQNNRINAGFFDGHVKALLANTNPPKPTPTAVEGRFTGEAVDPRYYYPTGTLVKKEQALHKNSPTLRGARLP